MKGASRGTPRPLQPAGPAPKASKTCEEKRIYQSATEASAHALLLPGSARIGLAPYLCRECGMFHLGHAKKKVRKP